MLKSFSYTKEVYKLIFLSLFLFFETNLFNKSVFSLDFIPQSIIYKLIIFKLSFLIKFSRICFILFSSISLSLYFSCNLKEVTDAFILERKFANSKNKSSFKYLIKKLKYVNCFLREIVSNNLLRIF